MTPGKSLHASVIEVKTNRGWAVTIIENGENTTSAVFRNEPQAQEFADGERLRLGLKQLHSKSASVR